MRRLVTILLVIPLLDAAAAPVAAQSPTTTEESLSGMVIEEVEPGVLRVVNDGVRDITIGHGGEIVAGQDGGIWAVERDRFYRLGDDDLHGWLPGKRSRARNKPDAFDVAPDGTVWTYHAACTGWTAVRSYDGQTWTTRRQVKAKLSGCGGKSLQPLDVAADGTVIAAWPRPRPGKRCRERTDGRLCRWHDTIIASYGADGWQPLGPPIRSDGSRGAAVYALDDGEVRVWNSLGRSQILHRADGAWQERPFAGWMTVGPDGTLWGQTGGTWRIVDGTPERLEGGPSTDCDGGWTDEDCSLVRFDGNGWRQWDLPFVTANGYEAARLDVAPDGSVWISHAPYPLGRSENSTPGGIQRFDGETWQHYLPGHHVSGAVIATDGSVWAPATAPGDDWRDGPRHLHVITPEAVAAVE